MLIKLEENNWQNKLKDLLNHGKHTQVMIWLIRCFRRTMIKIVLDRHLYASFLFYLLWCGG